MVALQNGGHINDGRGALRITGYYRKRRYNGVHGRRLENTFHVGFTFRSPLGKVWLNEADLVAAILYSENQLIYMVSRVPYRPTSPKNIWVLARPPLRKPFYRKDIAAKYGIWDLEINLVPYFVHTKYTVLGFGIGTDNICNCRSRRLRLLSGDLLHGIQPHARQYSQ